MTEDKIFILTSKYCWQYYKIGHPEAPFRVKDTYKYLSERQKKLNIEFVFIDKEIDEEILLLTHSKELIEKVKTENFYEPDTPNLKNIFFYAKISANIVLESLKLAIENKKTFALTRPPGHHATKNNLGGFCYFNNIACAINWYLKNYKHKKVAILDIDVHHGNGTQDIFLNNEKIIFISLHQANIYPATGLKSENNCINFPLLTNTTDFEYLQTLNKAIEKIIEFKPDLLAVSAGFDTFKEDTLAGLMLTEECYYKTAKTIKQLNLATFYVLEGGYSKKLPYLIEKFLEGLK